jgi:amino acid adenylation domain-containing protein
MLITFSLSAGQQALWFIYRNAPKSTAYNMALPLQFSSEIQPQILQVAVKQLVERHPTLRTIFNERDGIPYQQVAAKIDGYWREISVTQADDHELMNQVQQASQQPLVLEAGVFRTTLFHGDQAKTILLLTLHHIAGDAATLAILGQQLLELYAAVADGQAVTLPLLAGDYSDYVRWEAELLSSTKGQRMKAYWQKQLAGEVPILQLPTDYPRPPVQTFNGASQVVELHLELTHRLRTLARIHKSTLFTVLLSAYQVLLHRYSGQPDIWVGVPTSIPRNQPEFTNMVGYLVNLMVVRSQFPEGHNLTFSSLMQQTGRQMLTGLYHQPYPFTHLVEQLQIPRDPSYPPLVQVMFALERNDLIPKTFAASDYVAQRRDIAQMAGQFDLSLTIAEEVEGKPLVGIWSYNRDLFELATVARMAEHFRILLEGAISDAEQPIAQLPLLTEAEIAQLIQWNQTEADYPQDKTVIDWFEEQVTKTPTNLAVVFEDQQLSYQQLNERANQLAHHLLALQHSAGINSHNPLIAMAMERSLEIVISLLAILKAGGAYVPIDPSYPIARIRYMLADSAAPLLLTQRQLLAQLPLAELEQDCVVVCVEEVNWVMLPTAKPVVNSSVTDLAYVIYTSGSTGVPKGVMIEHQALTLHCQAILQQYALYETDKVLQFASFSFDVSLEQLLVAWLNGASSILVKSNLITTLDLWSLVKNQAITVINLPPVYWQQLLEIENFANELPALRMLILGGEALPLGLAQQTREYFPTLTCLNAYGPTEAVITAILYRLPMVLPDNIISVAIGQPRANTRIYILDPHYQLQPLGIPGELCIASVGLARGYLNRPDLTAEKFVEVELFGKTERIYKTGDLARWRPDGNLEYLGRLDHQIKLRGFRIELGEIETVLNQHPAVKEAVVILSATDDNQRLLAYLTTVAATPHDLITDLKIWLQARLPDYMFPSHFIVLEQLPLSPNGKIDRQALPAPTIATTTSIKLATPTEDLLASLWASVLKRDSISRYDNFFDLGGHSLLAMQLISRIRDSFQVELPVQLVFEQPQLSELATTITAATNGVQLPPLEKQSPDAPKVLSFAQQRLWFLNQLEENNSATYNMPIALQLSGNLDVADLQQSLYWLLERHNSLRTIFPTRDSQTQVQIQPLDSLEILRVHDLRQLLIETQSEVVQNWVNRHALEPFDLANGPLFKADLLLLDETQAVLLLNLHHISSDGWSMGIFFHDWQHAYTALAQGKSPNLPPLAIQYSDYAAWQRQWLQGEILQQQVAYWRQQLAGAPPLLELPTDKPRPPQLSYQGAYYSHRLSPTLTAKVTTLSHQQGVTIFMTLLSTFYILLSRYSRQEDFCVGSPIANRTHSQTEALIGFFVNTLVLRSRLQPQQSFLELLQATRQTCLAAYAHQDLPFEMLVEQLQPTRSLSYSPLFQVMFILQNNELVELTLPGLDITALVPDYPIAKFDLTLSITEQDDHLHCWWEYATDLFVADTIKRMAGHFERLLTIIVDNPRQAISQLSILTVAEIEQLQAWNNTASDFPHDQTIIDLFEQQVIRTPDQIAVIFKDQQLSYRQLNATANQLAHHLLVLQHSAGNRFPNLLIAIAVERSLEMVISLLGILKAGGAYVPIDPSYPAARIRYMLTDSAAPILLTQNHLLAQSPIAELEHECVVVCVDEINLVDQPTANPLISRQVTDLAYVIYTSGSTGVPKGVSMPQLALVNLLHWQSQQLSLATNEKTLQFTTLSFDVAFQEIFSTLLSGGQLVLVDEKTRRDVSTLLNYLSFQQIERLFVPVVMLQLLAEQLMTSNLEVPCLQNVITAGEQLRITPAIATWFKRWPHCRLHNHYGPSESHVVTAFTLSMDQETWTPLPPIGQPIANIQIYILDQNHQPQPPNIPGELCIAGVGLACGYLNHPDLTAEKFFEVELFGQTERIYKTGDLARWRLDGNLEYLGRLDHQVKLRGFRIELGEIEAVLSQHPAINEAVVILSEVNNNPRLVAYLTTTTVTIDLVTKLKNWLTVRLPDYMIPNQFMVLEKLPLTPNGKIDRQALPTPSMANVNATKPVTPTEDLLASLWASVLKRETISQHDNFFELGGHSLLATQLISRIRDSFQVELPVRVVFEQPQLSELATTIAVATGGVQLSPLEKQPVDTPKVLSFAQQRLWFLNQFEENNTAIYNMPAALQLSGNLDEVALQRSLYWLLERHASLRMVFPIHDGQATVQILDPDHLEVLQIHDLRQLPITEPSEAAQNRANHYAFKPFDLVHGPLFKVDRFLLNESQSVLLFNSHHIISDGWSMGVLIRDWQHAYTAFVQGESPNLPPLPIQYNDYAAWQRQWLQGEVLQQQVAYWRQQLAGAPPLLELPTDKPRPPQLSYQGSYYSHRLSPTLTAKVTTLSHQQGVTVFMTLLSTFYILLSRYSRQEDLCVGSPIANRTHSQTEALIGFFVNTLVLRSRLQPQQSFLELLQATRQTCLAAYAHQDLPFEMLVEQLQPTRSLSYSPLFQVMFILQNNDPVKLLLPDLDTTILELDYPLAKFDLTLSITERDEQLHCVWEYATDLFLVNTIQRIAEHFEVLLTTIVDNPMLTLNQLPMLTAMEIQQLQAWNDTVVSYPQDLTVVDLFEQQVNRTPDKVAVVFEDQQLTYRQLNAKANQLAHQLLTLQQQHLFANNPLIAIVMERSLEMVIGLLGILKAGGAYVPIDPHYPAARISYLLDDSAAPLLLTQSHLKVQLSLAELGHEYMVVCVEEVDLTVLPTEKPVVNYSAADLAYVIYTSGSTGVPKGVMIEHHNLSNFLVDMQSRLKITTADKLLAVTTLSFDIAALEIYLPLISGSSLYLVTRQSASDGLILQQHLIKYHINFMQATPATWQLLKHSNRQVDLPLNILCGGEILHPELAHYLLENSKCLWNVYGPTETTIWSSAYLIPTELNISPLIGQPIANTRIYILDSHHHPQPPGIPGELCIAGAGLARGYLNRPDLTAEKFIEVELFGQTERVYKTGDLARWLLDGNLEYLGRLDHQVKLRGFRIELGEIEAILTQHPAVKVAVVNLLETDDNKQLIAYFTTVTTSTDLITNLKDWLKARLPDYMIPSQFNVLEQLPLTPNGKIDRNALPAPTIEITTGTKPATLTENLLANLWANVLKRQSINRHDNFFDLGGHSLLATQLISRIRDSFQIELPVRVVFEQPQLSSLATTIDSAIVTVPLPPIEKQPPDTPKVLSFAQQRLWFLNQLEDNNSATYNMPAALQLSGNLNIEALQQSLRWLLERHTSLRTIFPIQAGQATIQTLDLDSLEVLRIHDLRYQPRETHGETIQNRINHHALDPFDLASGPLFKADLLLLEENQSILLLNWHHIINDGWSIGVFIRDWQYAYTAFSQSKLPTLPPLPLQYSDYAAWQRYWLQEERLQQQVDYWRRQLAGAPPLLELPTDNLRPPQPSYRGAHYTQSLSPTLTAKINTLSRQQGVSVFMTLLSTFYLLLSRYSCQEDLCVGSPIANRTHHQTEDLIGFFVNTLVLRSQLQPQQSFLELLQVTRQTCLAAYAHQDLPFEMLVEQLQPNRNLSHNPLFQVMFVLQNHEQGQLTLPGLEITILEPDYPIAKFDLTLYLEERHEQLHGSWEYATDLFVADTIKRMARHFEVLLTAIVDNPRQALGQISMLTVIEMKQLQAWNNTAVSYLNDQTIADLFEQQVTKTPDKVAVVFEDRQLTYQQLNAKANQLAYYLLNLQNSAGIHSHNPLIAIAIERSLEMVIGLLAIFKAGGAYVPIDPSYPPARIRYLLDDSAAPLLLTQSHLKAQLPIAELEYECVVVCVDEVDFTQSVENPLLNRQVKDLAYVIYTSGSTGVPKGISMPQLALVNLLHWQSQQFSLAKSEKTLQFNTLSFDVAFQEIFSTFLSGGQLVLVDEETQRDASALLNYLSSQQIERLFVPFVILQLLAEQLAVSNLDALQLQNVITAGEQLRITPAIATCFRRLPSCRLHNHYGPSESHVVTALTLPLDKETWTLLPPIGQPIANIRIYILDQNHQLQPPGITGELCIAGVGLACGYLNRPDLTTEKFIEVELFGQIEHIYKTGDLARWLPDGNLEYLGRLDHQVKLRGFRIELGEIESVLSQHKAVKEAVVIRYGVDDNQHLITYLTINSTSTNLIVELKNWLQERLPDYMIPSKFIVLDKLPLTPNNKTDRKALSHLSVDTDLSVGELVAPQTREEQLLANIWAEILGIKQIGIHNNFFDLGGNSLLIIKMQYKLSAFFDQKISVVKLFEHPTIYGLAQHLTLKQTKPAIQNRKDNRHTGKTVIRQQRQARQQHRLRKSG